MQHEYAQTYQQASSKPNEPIALKPPDGEDWQLHSWQQTSSGWLLIVWQREQRPHAMSEVYAHAPAQDEPQPVVKTVADIPNP